MVDRVTPEEPRLRAEVLRLRQENERLLDELRIHALVEGIAVLEGGAVAEGGAPYQVWRDVIRRLILQSDLSELEASILKPLIPDIERLVGYDVPDAPDNGAVASFNRLLVTITNVFIRQEAPLLLLLEDLQWSPESVEVLKKLGKQDNPLLELAQRLEEIALKDEYFIARKLYPNVDFYSGIIYSALGIPRSMFTVMFAIARTVGWVAHWQEMISDPAMRIGRPRQLYTGPTQRDYLSIEKRG